MIGFSVLLSQSSTPTPRTMDANNEVWSTVKKKTRKNAKSNKSTTSIKPNQTVKQKLLSTTNNNLQYSFDLALVLKTIASLESSTFYSTLLKICLAELPQIHSLIALGIGSFTTSATALVQFCLFVCLGRSLRSLNSSEVHCASIKSYIFDPTMSAEDAAICQNFDISVMTDNLKGKHAAEDSTLFFMPHCPYRLYCNLLWRNWSALDRVSILGNRRVRLYIP